MAESRRPPIWQYVVYGFAPAVAIMLLPVLILGRPHPGDIPTPTRIVATTLAATGAMAWALGFAVRVFRRMDEYFQAGSKFAWYWGGSIGLAASSPIYAFIGLGGLHWLFPQDFPLGKDLFRAFVIGYGLPIATMMIGFLVATAVWRWGKR